MVNTFCSGYDWSGIRVHLVATSAASGIGKTAEKLAPYLKGAVLTGAQRVTGANEVNTAGD